MIDDHSSDASLEVAGAVEDHRVRLFSSPGRGAAVARNLGLRHAMGDYIQYLDADDLLLAHAVLGTNPVPKF